ncbi:hypothetical protein AALC17_02965 [Oscillospiraceae bacterium 38-13]
MEEESMACKTSCKLCKKFVMSESITLSDAKLVVNIPAGDYRKGCKYCIVFSKGIPSAPTDTPVVITIGQGEEQYPFTDSYCAQATVCDIRSRTVYPTRVVTNRVSGTFRWVGRFCRDNNNDLPFLNGTAPAAPPAPTI